MNRTTYSFVLTALIVLLSPMASTQAVAAPLPEVGPLPSLVRFIPNSDQRAQLEQGTIITTAVRGDNFRLQAAGIINAPPELVWEILQDYDRTNVWAPDMAECRTIARQGRRLHVFSRNSAPWPISDPQAELVVDHEDIVMDGVRVLTQRWTMVPDTGNVSVNDGFWLLEPWGEDGSQTMAHQMIWLAPHVPVPAGVFRRTARRRLEANFKSFQAYAASRAGR